MEQGGKRVRRVPMMPERARLATLAVLLMSVLAACAPSTSTGPADAVGHATPATPAAPLQIQAWSLPAPADSAGSAQPDLVRAPDGSLLLSWVEHRRGGHALHFARYRDGRWDAPRQIAQGNDWFVNWADTPHIAGTADGALWAHWLRKSAQSTYAYDVVLARSGDDGVTWSAPRPVNTDGKPVEHGFVALWPQDANSLGVAWLDGRDTVAAGGHDGHASHDDMGGGAMMLRAAVFDATLQRRDEARVDAATCDCCQTDAAATARGPVVVFRDRAPGEIRDIALTRLQPGGWTPPGIVHADGWHMPACPVNGPAVAARDAQVLVAWYTGANDEPALKLARSTDAGAIFGAPVTVDHGAAVQGRVDLALDGNAAWVLWLREDGDGQALQLARFAPDLSREFQRIELARLQGRGRGTGLPKLALVDGRAHVVWTDVLDGQPRLHAAIVAAAP